MCLVYLFPILFYLFLLLIYLFIHSVMNRSAPIIVLLWGNQFLEMPLGCRWQGNRSSRMWEISEAEDLHPGETLSLCPGWAEQAASHVPRIPNSFLPTSAPLFSAVDFPPSPLTYVNSSSGFCSHLTSQAGLCHPQIFGDDVVAFEDILWCPADWVCQFDAPFLMTWGYNSPWHLEQRPRRFKNVAKGI